MEKKPLDLTNETVSPVKTVLLLAWPVFLEQVLLTMVQYVDTAMVGSLGAWATAAVAINQPPVNLINNLILALSIGFTALIARSLGAGDEAAAKKLVRCAVSVSVAVGIPLSLLCMALSRQIPAMLGAGEDVLDSAAAYFFINGAGMLFKSVTVVFTAVFRGYGDTKTPLYINTFVNLLNVAGNFLLIYPARTVTLFGQEVFLWGAGWQVAGAAAATALSTAVGGVVMAVMLFSRRSRIGVRLQECLYWDGHLLRLVWHISFPAMLERLTLNLGQMAQTAILTGLGTVALAASHLSLTAESLGYTPGFAFSVAATTLVGQALGAGKPELSQRYGSICCRVAVIIMCFAGVGMFLFAPQIIGLFSSDPEVVLWGTKCLKMVAVIQPIQIIPIVLTGVLRGAGDTKWAFYIVCGTMWIIRVLGSLLAVNLLGAGLMGCQFAMCCDMCARAVFFTVRFRRGKWKKAIDW
ncbi:MAG: MATE family efflux transporter [Oscillospiraceae bacterium]|nr:MATE family efflux transporter [Oscillospiraceae bacterium]